MGRNSYFQFKQFKIEQGKCAMKVGTDGVLIGAWCDVSLAKNILDIGTGTGLIALMAKQRASTDCRVTAIEIDEQASEQARENANASPWGNQITIINTPLQEFHSDEVFDLIVSNPPYFTNSLKAPDAQRSLARHNDSLTIEVLVENAVSLLSDEGSICVVLPIEEGEQFIQKSLSSGLYLQKQTTVYPTPDVPSKRLLIQVGKKQTETIKNNLIIEENGRHQYSESFKLLTKDYYLDK